MRQNNEDNLSTIDIEFHNASHHHSIHLSNHLSHTMASLSSMAVLLACEKSEESPRLFKACVAAGFVCILSQF